MLNQTQRKLEEAGERERLKREDLILTINNKQKEKIKPSTNTINELNKNQRRKLYKFLNKYKEDDMLIVKCRRNLQMKDLLFKKDDYYLFTFLGVLETYEKVGFILHDLKILNDVNKKRFNCQVKHDIFVINSKELFKFFKCKKSIGKIEYRYDQEYKYFYFNPTPILNNLDIIQKFEDQMSVYEYPIYQDICNL